MGRAEQSYDRRDRAVRSEKFETPRGVHIEIELKVGDIRVETWDEPSTLIEVDSECGDSGEFGHPFWPWAQPVTATAPYQEVSHGEDWSLGAVGS